MRVNDAHYRTIWLSDGIVHLIDQPKLPHQFSIAQMHDHKQTAIAIKTMITRGAGAIGATGAAGMAQAALEAPEESFYQYIEQAAQTLANTRPTAQNLFYGINTVKRAIKNADSIEKARIAAVEAAQFVADEDVASCKKLANTEIPLSRTDGRYLPTAMQVGWLLSIGAQPSRPFTRPVAMEKMSLFLSMKPDQEAKEQESPPGNWDKKGFHMLSLRTMQQDITSIIMKSIW